MNLVFLLILFQLCKNVFSHNWNKIKIIDRNYKFSQMQNVIINLDDVVRDYKYYNLIEIMTNIMPQLSHYNNIEFCISEIKLNEIFANKNQLKFCASANANANANANVNANAIDIYHECAIRDLQTLGKKINVDFSIIYVNLYENIVENKFKNYIGLDYYISKTASSINNSNEQQITHVIKNIDTNLLKSYWDLSLPIRVIRLKSLSLKKISNIQFDTNIPYIFNTSTFISC
jgi:hypothetical protein